MQWLFWFITFVAGAIIGYQLRGPRIEYRWRDVPVEVHHTRYIYVASPRLAARMRGNGQ